MQSQVKGVRFLELQMLIPPVAKIAMGAVLFSAGLAKIWDRSAFLKAVERFDILPKFAASPFAAILPAAEILTGLALFVGSVFAWSGVAWAGAVAMFLFAIFGVAIAFNLILGRTNISCGCFGSKGRRLTWGLVVRALACLAISGLTLPVLHFAILPGDLTMRLTAALVGVAVVAIVWLGRFVISGATEIFES